MTASSGAAGARDLLGQYMFERSEEWSTLATPDVADWDEYVEENREEWRQEADALLRTPAVQRFAAEQVAAALRDLADTHAFLGATLHNVPVAETYTEVAAELRARAVAVLADTQDDKREP